MQSILGKIDLGRNSHFETQGASSSKSISMDHYVGDNARHFTMLAQYLATQLYHGKTSFRALKEL
jgi:hypothetical protein